MICIRCDSTDFVEKDEVIEQDFGGNILKIECPATVCTMCGWVTVSPSQADELMRRTIAAHAQRKANAASRPEPVVGATYRNIFTGSRATLLKVRSNGVEMKHATKVARQNWHTFFTFWRKVL